MTSIKTYVFTYQYSDEFRVPCSEVVLIYLNEEVLLLHSYTNQIVKPDRCGFMGSG